MADAPDINEALIVTEPVSPTPTDRVLAETVKVSDDGMTALDGPEERTPRPRVATKPSAMRLNVSFDITFLSLVDLEAFPRSAW